MKTTLNLNDALLAHAKVAAVRQRTTLTKLIEEGLRLRLDSRRSQPGTPPFHLPTFDGGSGLVPGIDPTSNKAMLAAAGDDA